VLKQGIIDKGVIPWKGEFYKLIGLGEILMRASVRAFGGVLDAIGRFSEEIKCHGEKALHENLCYWLDRWLRAAVEEADLLGLSGAIKEIGRAQRALKRKIPSEIVQALDNVTRRTLDELQSVMFLHIRPEGVKYYDGKELFEEGLFGQRVYIKFSAVAEDIEEAGKCFALQRYTATVFHLMRVMEYAVQKIGKKLKVKLKKAIKDESWYNILKAINDVVKVMPEGTTRQKEKKDKYAGAAVHLNNVRIAWRNKVMHPKQTYTEEQAKTVLGAVEVFLKDIAELV
jgi:hypothetical protein